MSHKKTDSQLEASGTRRKDRHDKKQPTGEALTSLPDPPFYLSTAAKEIYQEEGVVLILQGLLKQNDLRLLACYSQEMDTYITLMEASKDGIIIELPNGISTASANRKAALEALKIASQLADRLGLSPIGRRRLGIAVDPPLRGREGQGNILDLIKGGKYQKKADPLDFLEDPFARFLQH